jgi:hypothetical protein
VLSVVAQQLQAQSSHLQTPVSQQHEPSVQQTAQEQSFAAACVCPGLAMTVDTASSSASARTESRLPKKNLRFIN